LTQIESSVAAVQRRGLAKVAVEFTLAAIAFNLKRLHRVRQP
jgi:IS5 family transposase